MDLVDTSSNGDIHEWKPMYIEEWGMCYSYHVPEYLKFSIIKRLSFDLKTDLNFFLHHPGQFFTYQRYYFQARANQKV